MHTSGPGDREPPVDPDLASEDHPRPVAGGPSRRRPRRASPSVLLAIALGGALGAPARYGVARLIHAAPDGFPWATFWTNLTGSFALGLILVAIIEWFPPTRYLRPFVATGFLGAYTTCWAFAVETDLLVKNGHAAVAVAYSVASLGGGILAVWAGIWTARAVRLLERGSRR